MVWGYHDSPRWRDRWERWQKIAMKEDKQRQFSILGQNLLSGQDDPGGDPLIKMIFSNREVLAWLLPHFISEYRGLGIKEIMEKYLPNAKVEIHKIPVHPGEAPPESVRTDNVEDKKLAEGTTVFDVVLRLPAPNRPERSIGVIIDIEVQKNDSPGYPIESRMIYYLCRTVSIQRGVVFGKSDYGDICKCYSIWLCPKLARGEPPSIDRFFLTGERVYGNGDVAAAKEDYDLIEGCIVRFNNDQTQPANDVIHFLQLLLTNIAPPLERLNELHEKYGLSKTREAENMCNYSEFLRQEGKEEGRQEGRREGRREGRQEGKEKEKLEVLEQLQLLHFSDKKIMTILKVDAEYLKCLRGKLREQRAVVTADD